MKLFGGYKSKRGSGSQTPHLTPQPETELQEETLLSDGAAVPETEGEEERVRTPEELAEIEELIESYQKYKKKKRIISLSAVILVLLAAFGLYKVTVRPPDIVQPTPTPAQPSADPGYTEIVDPGSAVTPEPTPTRPPRKRRENVYSFLLVGLEQSFANTDTIMVCVYDADAATLDVLSIPRDTCVNVESNPELSETKKINSVYSRLEIEGLREAVSGIMGYPIDSYVMVGTRAFTQLVDTIGPIYFYVPYNMNYDDPTQDLHIHFDEGYHYLYGADALKVVRWRQNNDGTNYGDIARIETQQNFLKTVAKQCLSLSSLTSNLDNYVEIFKNNVKTDLTTGNLAWYGQQVLKMSMEDIRFHTIPSNYNDSIRGFAYGTILVDEWLALLNERFNIYDQPIVEQDLNIITRDDNGELYATSGQIAGGYESFLDYDEYLVRLKEWNEYLESLKKQEEEEKQAAQEQADPQPGAQEPPADTGEPLPEGSGSEAESAQPEGTEPDSGEGPALETESTAPEDSTAGAEDTNGGE